MFSNTAIKITTNGKCHLGAALGTKTYKDEYVQEKVEAWCKEITKYAKSCGGGGTRINISMKYIKTYI